MLDQILEEKTAYMNKYCNSDNEDFLERRANEPASGIAYE